MLNKPSTRERNPSLINKPEKLLEYINDCLKPKNVEKKEFGEVFTPMNVINEMLDQLPSHIWKNPNLTWFDPASGMGNFPIAVYLRLMEGLRDSFPHDAKRKKHILEKMLYMSELNKKNAYICRQIFDIHGKYELNLYQGDTLKLNTVKKFGIEKFDIIMGNPPYNKGGIKSFTGKLLGEKNETVWPKFVKRAMEWLRPKGYLVFITPLSWLKKSHSMHDVILQKYVKWMKLWDNSKSLEVIHGEIPISLYVLQNIDNKKEKKETHIISEIKRRKVETFSHIYLDSNDSIPLAYHSIFEKLRTFIEKRKCSLEVNTKTVKSTGKKTKLPKKYTLADEWMVDTYTIKDGIMVKKGIEKHPDAGKRKLIISNKVDFKGAFIDEGKLGLTGGIKAYILGENLELLMKILGFKISTLICRFTKYGQDFLSKEAYTFIPDLRKLGIQDIAEYDFYKLIGLTKNELVDIGYTMKGGESDEKTGSGGMEGKKVRIREKENHYKKACF